MSRVRRSVGFDLDMTREELLAAGAAEVLQMLWQLRDWLDRAPSGQLSTSNGGV